MDRRDFVRHAAGGLSVLAVGTLTGSCVPAPLLDESALLPHHLSRSLGDDAVRLIGRDYLARTPREQDASALRAALSASARRHDRVTGTTSRSLDALVAADFDAGRTLLVDGWLLAVSEARQCALVVLTAV